MLKKIALIITYDGTPYQGWQDNGNNISIEGHLKKAFFELYNSMFLLDAASRTDRGVHAINQVVTTWIPDDKIPLNRLSSALNAKLPQSLRVKCIVEVPADFHPSLSIEKKTYLYQIDTQKSLSPFHQHSHWHYPYSLDLEKMKHFASSLIGKQDFSPFCTQAPSMLKQGVCELLEFSITPLKQGLLFKLTADRFLYKMCRTLIGTLCHIGSGKIPLSSLTHILSRQILGPTAPPQGLFLTSLYYPKYAIIDALTAQGRLHGAQ